MGTEESGNTVFFEGQFVPLDRAQISVKTHAFQYGTACLGGVRAYWNKEKEDLYLFRPLEHYKRLLRSAHILQMKIPYSAEELVELTLDLIRKNNWRCNVYVRPFIYKSETVLGPRLHDIKDELTIYTISLDNYLDIDNGLKTMVSSYTRISENAIPTRAKASAGYLNSALAKSEAVQSGMDEAIFLNRHGNIAEGSAENIFFVKNGDLITPSLDQDVLEGITRNTVIELAEKSGIRVIERPVARTELYTAEELFFSGTGVQIAWIQEVDRRRIGDKIGPVTAKLKDLFFSIVTGYNDEYKDWVVPVYGH